MGDKNGSKNPKTTPPKKAKCKENFPPVGGGLFHYITREIKKEKEKIFKKVVDTIKLIF